MTDSKSGADHSSGTALTVLAVLASLGALYWGQAILIPLALSILLSFALSPAVGWLQRLRLGRTPAVVLVVTITLTLLASVGYYVAGQLLEITTQLPQYRQNVHQKLQILQNSARGRFSRLAENLTQMSDELSSQFQPAETPGAVPVQVVQQGRGSFNSLRELFAPVVVPVEDLGIVVIFAIFILLEKERLRDRLLRLAGLEQLGRATKTLDDAADGVSSYLQMQLIVNTAAGLFFAFGLLLFGVPHAFLWGVLLGLLRFVPYVGAPVAAIMPVAFTIIATDGWIRPLLTIGLLVFMELALAQFIEPWLYGTHTGISSLAILVAGVFWGFLWGPLGLILSTPLTVCLVVLGRHVPHLQALNILLGDEPALTTGVRFYQRLLALDASEAREIVVKALKVQSLEDVYDEIVLPALSLAEQDRYRSDVRDARMEYICQSTSQIVEELAHSRARIEQGVQIQPDAGRIFCVGTSDDADRVTASMLSQVLEHQGWIAVPLSSEALDVVAKPNDIICLCALPPLAVMHARTHAKQMRERFPDIKIFVCLWGLLEEHHERAGAMLPGTLVTSMKSAAEEVGKQIASGGAESTAAITGSATL